MESKSSAVSTSSAVRTGHRRAARDDRLELVPFRDPAADVVDQLAQARAELDLVVAAVDHVPGEREETRAAGVLDTELRVVLPAELEDLRDGRERLDVVDERRRGVDAGDGREGRLRARLPALALERLEKAGLLAADVRTGPAVDDNREVPARAEDVRSYETRPAGLLERVAQNLELREVLPANVDEGRVRPDHARGDHAALDEHVREPGEDLAVLEGAGLRLVGVRDEVDRLRRLVRLGQEARLATHGKARPAAAAHVRREQLVEDGLGLHLHGFLERLVAADLLVLGEAREIAPLRVREEKLLQRLLTRSHCGAPRRWRGRPRASPARDSGGLRRPRCPSRSRPRTRSCGA